MKKDRIHVFLGKYLNGSDSNKLVWFVMLFVFILLHGQSQDERIFNINADIMVENLQNDSLITKRIFYDHMKSKDLQPSKTEITQKMCCSLITVYSKCKAALENKRKRSLFER